MAATSSFFIFIFVPLKKAILAANEEEEDDCKCRHARYSGKFTNFREVNRLTTDKRGRGIVLVYCN